MAWAPSPEAFAVVVKAGSEKLDLVLARYVREAEVYVVDLPGPNKRWTGWTRARCSCRPPPVEDGAPPQVRIFVYQRNVERAAGSLEGMGGGLARRRGARVTAVFLEGQKPDKNQLN